MGLFKIIIQKTFFTSHKLLVIFCTIYFTVLLVVIFDRKISEEIEGWIFPQIKLTAQEQNIKAQLLENKQFVNDFFQSSQVLSLTDKNKTAHLNLKLRTNYWSQLLLLLPNKRRYDSVDIAGYINLPLQPFVEEINQTQTVQKKMKEKLRNSTLNKIVLTRPEKSGLSSVFLDFDQSQLSFAVDYVFFHELGHAVLGSSHKETLNKIKQENPNYSREERISYQESSSDIFGVLLMAQKNKLTIAQTIDFLETLIATRYALDKALSVQNKTDSTTHNTARSLWRLKNYLVLYPTTLKELTPEELIRLSLDNDLVFMEAPETTLPMESIQAIKALASQKSLLHQVLITALFKE